MKGEGEFRREDSLMGGWRHPVWAIEFDGFVLAIGKMTRGVFVVFFFI